MRRDPGTVTAAKDRRGRTARPGALAAAAIAVWLAAPPPAGAAPDSSGLPLPRFVTLRAEEANMRTGPGEQYPIKWTYRRAGLPVEIVAEYHTWRRIRDWQGTEGWMHGSMLSGRRSFIVTGETRPLRAEPRTGAAVVAELEVKVIGDIEKCPAADDWCRVKVQGLKGWLRRGDFYGVYPDETVD
jgi:SH3-like domain-containing protein